MRTKSWPVSQNRIESLSEHMQAIGKNSTRAACVEMMDALIDSYLSSPVKDLRERVARDVKRLEEELSPLKEEHILRQLGNPSPTEKQLEERLSALERKLENGSSKAP